jgi:hypothetical protein
MGDERSHVITASIALILGCLFIAAGIWGKDFKIGPYSIDDRNYDSKAKPLDPKIGRPLFVSLGVVLSLGSFGYLVWYLMQPS